MTRATTAALLITTACALSLAAPAAAQEAAPWSWPEKPKNLKVLPGDWPGSA